jgi:transcriptional regulator of arginine metabolism
MATKTMRHATILDIVRRRTVSSQHGLARELRRAGIRVSQGTLSRDLKDLGLIKSRSGYRLVSGESIGSPGAETHIRRIAREFMLSADLAGNLLIVKTPPGCANPVAEALDGSGWRELVGTLAGDNTVLCVVHTPREGRRVHERLRRLLA